MTRPRLAFLALSALAAVMLPGAEITPTEPPPEPRRRPSGPPSRSREEARRRKQMAARGLPVVEPAPVDEGACIGVDEEGGEV